MPEPFDPYYHWLGIPPHEQPPNHYRLLSVQLFEPNSEVIQNAVDRLMAHLRTFQTGRRAAESQKLLTEAARAKICLLDVVKRAQYDRDLKTQLSPAPLSPTPLSPTPLSPTPLSPTPLSPTSPPVSAPVEAEQPAAVPPEFSFEPGSTSTRQWRRKERQWAIMATLSISVILAVSWFATRPTRDEQPKRSPIVASESTSPTGSTDPNDLQSVPETVPIDGADRTGEPAAAVGELATAGSAPPESMQEAVGTPSRSAESGQDSAPRTVQTTLPDAGRLVADGKEPAESNSAAPGKVAMPGPRPADEPNADRVGGKPVSKPTSGPQSPVSPFAPRPHDRLAVPSQADRARVGKDLKEQFAVQLTQANTPTAKAVLARAMLETANGQHDVVRQFVLLDMALNQAIQAGQIDLAFSAISEKCQAFDVDPLTQRVAALQANRSTNRYLLAWVAFELAEQARQSQRWDIAEQGAVMGSKAARHVRNKPLSRAFREQQKCIASSRQLALRAKEAEESLDVDPQNADARLTLGKYLCFVVNDWNRGLPHLANGSDGSLAQIAGVDIADSPDPEPRLALADAWFDWADGADELVQSAALHRALKWYVAAFPDLRGDERTRADAQLSSINETLAQRTWWRVRQLPWVEGPVGSLRELTGHTGTVWAVASSRDGRWAVTGGDDGTIRTWDLLSGTEIQQMDTVKAVFPRVHGLELAAQDRRIVAHGAPLRIGLWDSRNGKFVRSIPTEHRIRALATSPVEGLVSWAFNADSGSNVFVGDAQQPRTGGSFRWRRRVTCLAFSPDDRRLAAGDDRGMIIFWDLVSGAELFHIQTGSRVRDICFAPNGYRLGAATADGLVVYDAVFGSVVSRLSAADTERLAYLGDGRLVSTGTRGGLSLWDISRGTATQPAEESLSSMGEVSALTTLPDPRAVLVGLRSGKVLLWRLPDRD